MSAQTSSPVVTHRWWMFTLLFALLVSAPREPALSQTSLAQVADTSPFRALALPTATDVRSGSGRPGAKYWQQRADYKITATLDPARNELRGRETIHYTNHSPDALPYLWLFVEQNLCAPNSITNQLNQPPLVFLGSTFDFSCQGFNGGGHHGVASNCGCGCEAYGLRNDDADRSGVATRSGRSARHRSCLAF